MALLLFKQKNNFLIHINADKNIHIPNILTAITIKTNLGLNSYLIINV